MKFQFVRRHFALVVLGWISTSSVSAQIATGPIDAPSHGPSAGGITLAGDAVDNVLQARSGSSLSFAPAEIPAQNLGSFNIVISPGSGLASNADALAAFNRAGQAWAARVSDPITVTINANLGPLGSGIIGSTSSVVLQGNYGLIRDQMVTDAADETDDAITASLPTDSQFSAFVPSGSNLNGNLLGTKANLKALGFAGLDGAFGISDAAITFSSSFAFDFDNRDGVGAGLLDFETVAIHEIGHALGFISIVDSVNAGVTSIAPFTLDLYRFANETSADPATAADFTTFSRNLIPGVDAITDQITGGTPEWRMSTGLMNDAFSGTDGRQASHWKADDFTGWLLGVMDPTLASGVAYGPMEADFRALDLIGYDLVSVPEISTSGVGLLALLTVACSRRRLRPQTRWKSSVLASGQPRGERFV